VSSASQFDSSDASKLFEEYYVWGKYCDRKEQYLLIQNYVGKGASSKKEHTPKDISLKHWEVGYIVVNMCTGIGVSITQFVSSNKYM